ncbi:MAG: M20/M25/M40 family metallo-hydrolase [Cytophagales bacterium]|nr:M20/M25/M40 family metallo-hydrolase [Cytophagales bacterium]
MKNIKITLFSLSVLLSAIAQGQNVKLAGLKAIDSASVRSTLSFLASDWMEGREVGRKGAYMASEYIANLFDIYGLKPLSGNSFFQPVQLIEFKAGKNQEMQLIEGSRKILLKDGTDFKLASPSQLGLKTTSEIVFVGYGLQDETRNDYKELDVKGKIILRLSGFPQSEDKASKMCMHYTSLGPRKIAKQKESAAVRNGAVAVLELNLNSNVKINWANNNPAHTNLPYYEGEKPLPSYYETKVQIPALFKELAPPVFRISERMAKHLLNTRELKSLEKTDAKSHKQWKSALKGKKMQIVSSTESELINCRNVLGKIEGKNPNDILVVGAHYDHLGTRGGYIWNGADDNASGVTAILSIAKAFQATGQKPEKTVVFAAWTGEEKGLNGSKHFVKNFTEINQVQLYLNFDMIGRNSSWDTEGNKCMMLYTKAFGRLEVNDKLNNKNFRLKLDIAYSRVENPNSGSDNVSFHNAGIPIYWYHTWGHPDYHKATDHAEKINWTKMRKIIKLSFLNSWDYANGVDFLKKGELSEEL